MAHQDKLHGSRGFTLVELLIAVVIVALIGWAAVHYFGWGSTERKSQHPATEKRLVTTEQPTTEEQTATPAEGQEDSSAKTVIKVILVGLLWAGGITWQVYLIISDMKDGPAMRVLPAAIAGGVLLLGVVVVSGFEVFDERRALSIGDAFGNAGRATVLSLALMLKSYLGPLTVALALSSVVYFLMTYGELRTIPLIQGIFDWVFIGAPRWLSWVYAGTVGLYSLGGAIHDTDINL